MPAIITATAASLAMAAGLTAYLLTPEPSQQKTSLGAVAEPKPSTRELRTVEPTPACSTDQRTKTTTVTSADGTMSIAVLSLESDDLQQLNIDLASLGMLRSMVPHADSIAQWSGADAGDVHLH
jgi:hypothetical protein